LQSAAKTGFIFEHALQRWEVNIVIQNGMPSITFTERFAEL